MVCYERVINKGEITMEHLWAVVAVLLSPFGEGCQAVMMKIFKCLSFLDWFAPSVKGVGDAVVVDKVVNNKHCNKVVTFAWITLATGGLYLYWLLFKWIIKLIAKLFKAIFRKRV